MLVVGCHPSIVRKDADRLDSSVFLFVYCVFGFNSSQWILKSTDNRVCCVLRSGWLAVALAKFHIWTDILFIMHFAYRYPSAHIIYDMGECHYWKQSESFFHYANAWHLLIVYSLRCYCFAGPFRQSNVCALGTPYKKRLPHFINSRFSIAQFLCVCCDDACGFFSFFYYLLCSILDSAVVV